MSAVGGNDVPARLGLRPAPEGVAGEEPHEGIVIAATLGRIERELRRIRSLTSQFGRQFTRQDGGQATGGVFSCVFEGPKSGADWYVERVSVSVAGASAAGVLTLFASQAIDESNFLDILAALSGNTPSRGVLDGRGTPYFLYGGAPCLVLLSGVVAGSTCQVRLQGREVLSGADPALRPQDY